MSLTPAGEQVTKWLSDHGHTREWLAEQLCVRRETLWRWLVGGRVPRIEHCVAIERITGVAAAVWVRPRLGVAA